MDKKEEKKISKNTIKEAKVTKTKTSKTKVGLHGKDTVVNRSQKFRLEQKKKEKIPLKERIKKIDKRVWISLISLIIVVLIIALVIFFSNLIYWGKYKHYEEKMDLYQFSKLYNDGDAKTSDKVTKAEAIKLALATVFNTDDISGFAEEYDGYPNENWVEYAKYVKIIGTQDITKDNYNAPVTYLELVSYFSKAKEVFTEYEISTTDKKVLKNESHYDPSIQIMFSDMVENKIIVVETENIDASDVVIKGKVNELVVNFLEQYGLISIDGSRLRFTDLPSNAADYPYILFDVPNEVYEYENIEGMPLKDEMTSRDLYTFQKSRYEQVKRYVENYYKTLLNVDYNTIDFWKYTDEMDKYLIYTCEDTIVYNYVEYVKNNHIHMQADVKLMEPCIYFDGSSYRVRIKIDLKILNTDTRDNLILYDAFSEYTYTYNQNEYTIYADTSLTNALNTSMWYIEPQLVLGDIALNYKDLDISYIENVSESLEVQ